MMLHIDAASDDGRPALLLVHGFLSSRNNWRPNRGLSENFRLVAIDLPAHGLSPAPGCEAGARPEALVHAIEIVRQRLNICRLYICGQSFGAALTRRYALTFPDRVIAQIFTNATGALREAWNVSQHDRNLVQIDELRNEGHAAMRRMAYHPSHAKRFPPDLRDVLTRDADSADVDGIALLLEQAMPRLSVRDRLSALCVPTLLVNGLWENGFRPTRQWLSRTHPHIAVEELQGGHSINIECPDSFNAAVSLFSLGIPIMSAKIASKPVCSGTRGCGVHA